MNTETTMQTPVEARSADGVAIPTDVKPPALIYWLLQPALLVFLYLAATETVPGIGLYIALLAGFAVLTLGERIWPARREWTQTGVEWLQVLGMFVISALALLIVEIAGSFAPGDRLQAVRDAVTDVWPSGLPFALQVALMFFMLQFMAYWLHRWQHESGLWWRTFGHGTHHTYTKLSAINWNTAHPFEAVPLVLPPFLLALLTGLGDVIVIAVAMGMMIAACAHANLRLNERGIGYLVTTNSQHMQHHSADFAESQTNYGCSTTLWDRVFGTFSTRETAALGDPMDGKRTIWRRLTVPLRRPG
ncbi:MAG: sterol desaturase family protein [Pacificimonas sp.]